MNFLAHLHVGRQLEPVASAGNLLADYCKSSGNERFREGVSFHRQIDSFTDSNEVAGEARALFNASYRHFGGVLSDLAFDWCLARTWDEWSSEVTWKLSWSVRSAAFRLALLVCQRMLRLHSNT